MKKTHQREDSRRARLKKETLRGLGFAELDEVHGGDPGHPRPICTRYCVTR